MVKGKHAYKERKRKHAVERFKKRRLDLHKLIEEGQKQIQNNLLQAYLSIIEAEFPHLLDDPNQKRFMQNPIDVEWIMGKDSDTWERIIQESSIRSSSVNAWSARYDDPKGANLDRLLKQFDNGNQAYTESIYGGANKSRLAKPIYMNGFSIVQTSGSGKSRSIVELKQKGVFVCYCSFQQGHGVPLRSPTLAKYVEDYCTSVDTARGYVRAWLVVLKKWCQAKKRCVDWCEEHVIIESTQKSRILDEVCREWNAVNDCREEDLRCLLDDLEKFTRKRGVKVLFAFDESRHLFKEDGIGFYLRRVITIPGIMATFVDTKASFIDIAPPASLDPSLRPRLDQATVLRPFWELLTTNCLAMDLNQTEYPTSEELLDFGRPLWAAERRGGTDVIALAASKLVGGVPHAELENLRNGKELSQEQAVAVLNARLAIDVLPRGSLAAELAAGYMCYLLDVSDLSTDVTICEPWDPALSAAACTFTSHKGFRLAALRHLKKLTKLFLVDEGKNGELIARYILMRTRDECVKADDYFGSFSFKEFTEKLLGDQDVKERNSRGSLSIRDVLTADLRTAQVNFNSFISITYTPTMEDLKPLWKLRKAAICKTNQAVFDLFIPIKLPDQVISVAAFQVKSRVNYSPSDSEASLDMSIVSAGIADAKFSGAHATFFMNLASETDDSSYIPVLSRNKKRGINQAAFLIDGLSYACVDEDEIGVIRRFIHQRRSPFKDAASEFVRSVMPYAFKEVERKEVMKKAKRKQQKRKLRKEVRQKRVIDGRIVAAALEEFGVTVDEALDLIKAKKGGLVI